MGEMADFTLEQIEDEENFRYLFRHGLITDIEAYDRGIIDERGYEIGTEAKPVSCRNCNKKGLLWKQHKSGKWWLAESDDTWHNCKEKK